jgi:hypothetical protein
LALSAGVPARIAEALLADFEEMGLIAHGKGEAIKLAVPLAAFRSGARELVSKVKTFAFEGERKLKLVAEYAHTPDCRSVFIRRYFGENDPPRCGNCDRCRPAAVVAPPLAPAPGPSRRRKRRRRRKRPSSGG